MKIIEKIKNWWQQDHEAITRKQILNQMFDARKLSVMPPFMPTTKAENLIDEIKNEEKKIRKIL